MKIEPFYTLTAKGARILIKSPGRADAQMMLDYLRRTAQETPFLMREPDEMDGWPVVDEENFLEDYAASSDSLMLCVYTDGKFAGNCSFSPVGSARRVAHRCSFGIALFAEFCGLGIGETLMRFAMDKARECGYETMELDVVADNAAALSLYCKLGFELWGKRPRAMKYRDGRYADELIMGRPLVRPQD